MSKAIAYTPLEITKPTYTLPIQPSETVIEKDKEFFHYSATYSSNDGAIHTATFYTVPTGQVLFVEEVSVVGCSNDFVAADTSGYTLVTNAGRYIGGVYYVSGSSSCMNNTYKTPIKLLEGDTIGIVYFQPTAGKQLRSLVIVNGYLLSNF
jgi:hypothetical protein